MLFYRFSPLFYRFCWALCLSHDILSVIIRYPVALKQRGGHCVATIILVAILMGLPRTPKDPALWSLLGPWAVFGRQDSFAKSWAQPNANH